LEAPISAAGRRRRVLVVDDNRDVRESVGDLLDAAGFEVECADGGRTALAYLHDHGGPDAVDVILLDYALGDMTAVDFLAKKAREPALAPIPIVFLTGDGRASSFAAASGHDCLGKPTEVDDLLAALDRQTRPRG
jgi:CheY-like chemotaxis protein